MGAAFLGINPFQWLALLVAIMTLLLLADAFSGHYRSGFTFRAQYAPFVTGGLLIVSAVTAGIAPGSVWEKMPPSRFFQSVLSITIVKIYYAHPQAWNEIGYAGPSSPRGHVRKWEGDRDPWEAQEEEG